MVSREKMDKKLRRLRKDQRLTKDLDTSGSEEDIDETECQNLLMFADQTR